MDMQALHTLVAAIEEGSLSAAARRLGVSQPAVSQKLVALEGEFGQKLLMRSQQGVRPTPAGRLAFEHCMRVLATLADMRGALDAFKGEVAGTLRVSAHMLLSQTIMGPVIAGLRRWHPRLKIDLMAGYTSVDFDADKVDVALYTKAPLRGSGTMRKIGEFECVLVSTPGYLDAIGRPVGPEDLARLVYIQCEDPADGEIALRHQAGVVRARVTPAFMAQYPELTLHAVTSGLGFATAPRFYVQEQIDKGEFEVMLPGYAAMSKPLFLVQAEHVKDMPRARAFVESLEATLGGIGGFTPAPLRPIGRASVGAGDSGLARPPSGKAKAAPVRVANGVRSRADATTL